MKKTILSLLALALAATPALAAGVVNLAPDFSWEAASHVHSLRAGRGQPVVLIVGRTSRTGAFRSQVKNLRKTYEKFAARGTVFAAAVLDGDADIRSDIPFVVVRDPQKLAAALGVDGDFALVIIGKDGNLDYVTDKPAPGWRVRDVIQNSYAIQSEARK
jgi:peroxiredoxin